MKNKILILLSIVSICATLVVCSLILIKPNVLLRKPGGISVKGYAVQKVVSDIGEWACAINARAATQKEAYLKLKDDLSKSVEFIKSKGAPADAVTIGGISAYPVKSRDKNGYLTEDVIAWVASATIGIQSADVALIYELNAKSSELNELGIEISNSNTRYFYTNLESLKLELIGRASANARERAQKLAGTSGGKLGGVLSASQGVFQITRPLSTETSDWGMYETGTIEKEVKCTVNVQFAVEK